MRLSKTRRTTTTTNAPHWPTLTLAALGLLIGPVMAHAAGFGPLRVQSNLGQPLQAEIDITGVTADEAQNLAVRLATPDAYRAAGLTYHPIVGNLRVQLERRAPGSYVAYVRSAQPVNEPFVDILVDMSWASGRVSRAYTFLLDPVGSKAPKPAVTSSAVAPGVLSPVVPDNTRRPAPATAATPAAQPPVSRPARSAASTRQAAAAGGSYTVQRGDSLYGIAADAAQTQDAVSLDQMLLSLYRNNPSAFIGGNINRLKAGAVLKIPSASQARDVPPATARREVIAHTQGFGSYRDRLASSPTPSADSETARQRSGRVTARVQDQTGPSAAARDELTLSRAERDGRNSLAAVNEELIAKDRALKEAQERLAQLEKNLADLQRLVTLKNGEAPPGAAGATGQRGATPTDAATLAVPAAGAASMVAAAPSAQAASAPAAASEALAGPAAASEPAAQAPVAASAPVAVPAPAVAPVPAPQPAEPGFFAGLMNNPTMLAAIAALLALVGAFVWLRRRRNEGADGQDGFQDSLLSQESTVMAGANSLFGAPGGQSVDTSQHSVFGSDFRLASTTADANEVDPVAEADVYIAYGRDIQAEEILREALERQPERQAVRLKLLEIYATRQDIAGFNAQAEVMHAQTKGIGPEWTQAAALGLKLDPANPLYAAAGGVAGAGTAVAAAAVGASQAALGDDTSMRLDGDAWLTVDPALDGHTKPLPLGDLELPLDAFPPSAFATAQPLSAGDDMPGGLPPVRLGGGDTTLPVDAETRPLEIDLSGISLDLGSDLPADTTTRAGDEALPGNAVRLTEEPLGPLTLPSDSGAEGAQELHIKLDLAKAYVEIGDKDGARELLQEVIEQADGGLRAEAEALLAQLR